MPSEKLKSEKDRATPLLEGSSGPSLRRGTGSRARVGTSDDPSREKSEGGSEGNPMKRESSVGATSRVAFREYAPGAWAWLRVHVYGVDAQSYTASMGHDGADAVHAVLHKLTHFSEAKGGGFFFFSPDLKYMVKSMSGSEHAALLSMLPLYTRHMHSHPASTITRIFGVYSIRMYHQTTHFFVMENLFCTPPKPHEVFDMKGSWVDRHAKAGSKTRLDSDWDPSRKLNVSAAGAEALLRQVCHDAHFLASCHLMDYSLLLGINHVTEHRWLRDERRDAPAEASQPGASATGRRLSRLVRLPSLASVPSGPLTPGASNPELTPEGSAADANAEVLQEGPRTYSAVVLEGPGTYRLGIIDLLQTWNAKKRLERYAKILFKGRCAGDKRNGMSAVEPWRYARRFVEHVGVHLLGTSPETVADVWAHVQALAAMTAQPSAAAAPHLHPAAFDAPNAVLALNYRSAAAATVRASAGSPEAAPIAPFSSRSSKEASSRGPSSCAPPSNHPSGAVDTELAGWTPSLSSTPHALSRAASASACGRSESAGGGALSSQI